MSKAIDKRLGSELDIEVEKGRTLYRIYHCQYYDSGNTLQDFSFTNYSAATMTVKRKPQTSFSELTFSTDDNTIKLGNEGRVILSATSETMNTIRSGAYEYDLYLKGTDEKYAKRELFYGKFIVTPKITT